MARVRFIVCEKTNHWAVALRWALAPYEIRVYEARTWLDCLHELDKSPTSLLAVELRDSNVEEVSRGLVELQWRFPRAAAIVLSDRRLKDCEWAIREAGALHVVSSRRSLGPVARLVSRFLEEAPQPEQNLEESLLDHLPWSDS